MRTPVYLDHNATTPTDPEVLEHMLPYFTERFGNPSSAGHSYGWIGQEAVERAREEVAGLLGAEPVEIVFTSGATEAINLAIKGVAAAYAGKGDHIITAGTEHKAVLDTCAALERVGMRVTVLGVGSDGRVDPSAVEGAITERTVLISLMWANNVTGVLHPMKEISAVARKHGVLLLSDATQAVGKVPVDVSLVDLLACSAHKFYGPKGVGALFVRRRSPRVRLVPLLDGGSQERGLRGGTLNTPGIVGLGAAASLAGRRLEEDAMRLAALRDRLEGALLARLEGVEVNGSRHDRLPQTSNLRVDGVRAADLMTAARSLAFSAGSACSSADAKPSHALTAMGLSDEAARSSIRLGLGRATTEEEVDFAASELIEAVTAARSRAEVTGVPS